MKAGSMEAARQDQGAQLLLALGDALAGIAGAAGMGGMSAVLQLDALSPEALAAIPATQLPCAVLAAGPPVRRGRWKASVGELTLWELPVKAGVALLQPAGQALGGGHAHWTQQWGQRLASVLEQEGGWSDLAASIRREGPPASLRAGLVGCVYQGLILGYVTT